MPGPGVRPAAARDVSGVRGRVHCDDKHGHHDGPNTVREHWQQVVGDEAVPVCPLTRLASEVLLEIGQRAVGAEREHRCRENHGGKVCPHIGQVA